MRKLILGLLMVTVAAGCAEANVTRWLEEFQWKKRVVIALADSVEVEQLQSLRAQVKQQSAALAERDVTVVEVVRDTHVLIDGAQKPHLPTRPFFAHFEVQEGEFTYVLIGKDGFEKLRKTGKADLQEIIALIDEMPMRRGEAGSK